MVALIIGGDKFIRERMVFDVGDLLEQHYSPCVLTVIRAEEDVIGFRSSVYLDSKMAKVARAVMTMEEIKMVKGLGIRSIALISVPDSDGIEGDYEEFLSELGEAREPYREAEVVLALGDWGDRTINVLDAPKAAADCLIALCGEVV